MKIGFDGKRATNNLTGLGNYSRSLITQLAKFFPQNQYLVYTPKIKEHAQIRHFLNIKNILTCLPNPRVLFWRTVGIKKQLIKDQVTLYHGLSHEIPLGIHKSRIASVVTIHDLIFLKFPQYFGLIDRLIYKLKFSYACRHADRIIAISECTKRDIITYFHTDPDKIDVVYQSCDDSFKSTALAPLKTAVKLKHELHFKYILNVGTIEPRKNLLTLVQALPYINKDYKLIVVGKLTAYTDIVRQEAIRLGVDSRLVLFQNIPFNELPSFYQMASAFVYPSLYEGFGIPVIEALYSQVPVVAATGSCLEEAGGPDSKYVSPLDHMAMSAAVNEILDNQSLAEEMKAKGLAYVQKFNNEVISEEMMNVYNHVLSTDQN